MQIWLQLCFTTCRLEAELEAKRTKEKEEMMKELQAIKDAAQREMETQKGQFQEHLEQLSSKMVCAVVRLPR